MRGWRIGIAVAALALLGWATPLHAQTFAAPQLVALDLSDRTARDVVVRFERSPRMEPAALDRVYGDALPARLEPGPPGHVYVVIGGQHVAQQLFEGQHTDGFGDFVWLFDSRTGDVVDARVEGALLQEIDWGLHRSSTRAEVRVRMNTREAAGFRDAQHVLGNLVFRYCDPHDSGWTRCNPVEPVRFDPATGYVNAVGAIEVDTPVGISALSFSPLGEARFFDLEAGREAVAAAEATALHSQGGSAPALDSYVD
jgi:hypothetical protein